MTTNATDGAVRLPVGELARLLGNAAPFAGTDATLPMLCAVRLRSAGGVLTVEATDRYALVRETFPLTAPAAGFAVAVPVGVVAQVRAMLTAARRADRRAWAELTARTPSSGLPVLRITAGPAAVEVTGVYGFPDTDSVFAKEDAHTAGHGTAPFDVQVNPWLLARLAKLRPAGTGRGNPPRARLTQPAPGPAGRWDDAAVPQAHPVHAQIGDRLRVLVMPMRPDTATGRQGRAA